MKSLTYISIFVTLIGLQAAPIIAWDNSQRTGASLKVKPKIHLQAYPFELQDVKLLDGPFKHAMELDGKYLLKLEPDRLLSRFREYAGIKPRAAIYGGWEAMGVSGHTLGHYLSACSMMYGSTGDKKYLERVCYIVDELAECQKANGNGYVGAVPDGKRIFEEIAKGDIRSSGFDLNGCWVPWYTLHKLYAGLRDAWTICGNAKAKGVLIASMNWVNTEVAGLNDEQFQKMLACEQGGMNEVCADTYAITGDSKYLRLADRFTHHAVMDPLARKDDKLTGLHANTQIPKVIGMARQYELSGEQKDSIIAKFFWDTVTRERSYVIGGNSDGEHFSPKEELSKYIGPSTAETCNTYNMLKLTKHLFTWDPMVEYADFTERALYNHILSSQNPETGMMCYFVPLKTGSSKAFNEPYDSFWCCTGTGIENHAKYGESIYFHDGAHALWVNLFVASELNWKSQGVTVRQETDYPKISSSKLSFTCKRPVKLTIRIRRPFWAIAGYTIKMNGKNFEQNSTPGSFVDITRVWSSGDLVEIHVPMTLRTEAFRDNPNRFAFLYGPLVLCSETQPGKSAPAVVTEQKDLTSVLKKTDENTLAFTGSADIFRSQDDTNASVKLIPFDEEYKKPYIVYWDRFTAEQWKQSKDAYQADLARIKELDAKTVDFFQPGEMQPERDHELMSEKSNAGDFGNHKWRDARDGGWFSFKMKVIPDQPQELRFTWWGSDSGEREFEILVNDVVIAVMILNNNKPDSFFDTNYPLTVDMLKGKEQITVRLAAHPGRTAGGLFGCRVMRK